MACAAAVLKRWHTDQNKILRCSGGSLKFWTDQVEGGYLTHVNDCLDVLFNMQALHDCGFATDAKEASVVKNDMTAEDEYAALLCDQQRILAGLRMKRHLNTIVGHPRSFLAGRKGGRRAQEVCDEFPKDFFVFSLPPTLSTLLSFRFPFVLEPPLFVQTCLLDLQKNIFITSIIIIILIFFITIIIIMLLAW